MEIAALAIIVILGLRALVVMVNLLTRQWLRSGTPERTPPVSVLIPARNEEKGIGNLLRQLGVQDYQSFEVIVYNDASTDNTAAVAEQIAHTYSNFKVITSHDEPPEGWLGKNHACHILAQRAQGEYLLFLDADVMIEPNFITDAISHTLKHDLQLFSLFPVQKMETNGEKMLVPLMNRILLSLLPLIFTRISRRRSLSAANGQSMLFRTDTYRKHWFHKKVKSFPVEDIRIFRMMKRLRLKSHTMLSNGQISCRMYNGFDEALKGFSKNIFEFFGGSVLFSIVFALTTSLGWIPVLLSGSSLLIFLWCSMTLWINIVVSKISRQNIFMNLLLAVPQQIAFLRLIVAAFSYRMFGGYRWKGRDVKVGS